MQEIGNFEFRNANWEFKEKQTIQEAGGRSIDLGNTKSTKRYLFTTFL